MSAAPVHRQWLLAEALSLLRFFLAAAINPAGGFYTLTSEGKPVTATDAGGGPVRQLHDTTRLVHCYCIAHLRGLPGACRLIDDGMQFLMTRHRDSEHGGYFWAVDDTGSTNASKQAYGHAFVQLAASSARTVGHPQAEPLFNDVTTVLTERFLDEHVGATTEEYTADWQSIADYCGQNSNMHLTEALMAEGITELIINRHARQAHWRVVEHFSSDWSVERDDAGGPMFRPRGTTPGYALEWSRLLMQLWELGGRGSGRSSLRILVPQDLGLRKQPFHRSSARWLHPELDAQLQPVNNIFTGKPDLYHAPRLAIFHCCPPPAVSPEACCCQISCLLNSGCHELSTGSSNRLRIATSKSLSASSSRSSIVDGWRRACRSQVKARMCRNRRPAAGRGCRSAQRCAPQPRKAYAVKIALKIKHRKSTPNISSC